MTDQQYVSLVAQGGTPVRLADQRGAPYPTTGYGALVFANGPTLNQPTLVDPVISGTPWSLENVYIVQTLAALQNLTVRPTVVQSLGYDAAGDGGGGLWRWVAGSTAAVDNILVVQPIAGIAGRYLRVYSTFVDVKWAGAKGTSTQDISTGAWSGPDDSSACRAAWLVAKANSLALYFSRGNYRIDAVKIIEQGEVFSGAELYGDDEETILIGYTTGRVSSYVLIDMSAPNLPADGIAADSPTYYFTSPAVIGQTIIPVNTVSGLTVNNWVQILNRQDRTLDFEGSRAGITTGASIGQVSQIRALDTGGTTTFTIVRGTYNNGSGTVGLVLTDVTNFERGVTVTLSGLTGTGSVVSLEGARVVSGGAPGYPTLDVTCPSGLGAITITGGTMTYISDGQSRIIINGGLEFDYPGTSTSPGLYGTALRRYNAPRENVLIRNMKLTYDRTAPPIETQYGVSIGRTISGTVRDMIFDWYGRSVSVIDAIKWRVLDSKFTGASDESYQVYMANAACYGKLSGNTSQGGRHFVQGTSDGTVTGAAHNHITNNHCIGSFWAALGTHGSQRDCLFEGNHIVGSTKESTGDGIQFRGTRLVAKNNLIVGCVYGVESAFGADCTVDGGEFVNCETAIRDIRTYGFKVINSPIIRGSVESHFKINNAEFLTDRGQMPGLYLSAKVYGEEFIFDSTNITYDSVSGLVTVNTIKKVNFSTGATIVFTPQSGTGAWADLAGTYTVDSATPGDSVVTFTAVTGLVLTVTRAFLQWTRQPTYGDMKWLTNQPGQPMICADDSRFDIDCITRSPIVTTWDENDVTPSVYPFPDEFLVKVGRKTADFSFVPYLPAVVLIDTASAAVTGTLPDARITRGMRVQVKKINTGGSAATIACFGAQTIDGSATKTLADNEFVELVAEGDAATANWYII